MKCKRCGKNISDSEKRTRITTFMEDKSEVDEWFHFQCWIDEFKQAVTKKLEKVKDAAIGTARKVVGSFFGNKPVDEWIKDETKLE